MKLLYDKPSRIYSRQQIIDFAYHQEKDIHDRTVDSPIKNLRRKIKSMGIEGVVIDCIYGAGYQYLPVE
jgi:two-component system response regulator BaeR